MKPTTFPFTLFLCLLLTIPSLHVYGQFPGGHVTMEKCSVCGKTKQNCPYKGNHPKSQPTTGTLSITSTPSEAVVKIGGKYMGETPFTLENQKPTTYKVTVSAEGYESVTKSVTVAAGKTATCSVTLKKKQAQQPVAQQSAQQPATATTSSSAAIPAAIQQLERDMVFVEGGTFTMGATAEQGSDAYDNEKPARQVTLSSFRICKHEVTQAEWEAVMGSNPSKLEGANRPVEQVSWDDCQTFIRKLNAMTGKQYRLPTEAEWEYAARGGQKSQGYKYSGSNTLGSVAWYTDNSGLETHPVMTKQANELGLYDMSGNVWEWCSDWYGDYNSAPQTNPKGSSSGSFRVLRGGSWINNARGCRVPRRGRDTPDHRSDFLGLRLAHDVDDTERRIELRKKLIKEELSDSIKNTAPSFGLG